MNWILALVHRQGPRFAAPFGDGVCVSWVWVCADWCLCVVAVRACVCVFGFAARVCVCVCVCVGRGHHTGYGVLQVHCLYLCTACAERLDPWCSGLPLQEVSDDSETSHQGAR